MAISQNGWTVITSGTNENLVAIPKIAGRVRKGDVAAIFTDLVEYFDKNIEDVDKGKDEWGYAFRAIRGQSSGYSNHASGTAIDLSATQHPIGARNTFSDAQEKKIRAMLKERYLGKIRWGGDYQNRADEMHFEVNGSAADMKKVVAHLKALNSSSSSSSSSSKPSSTELPTISLKTISQQAKAKKRTKSSNVKRYQQALKDAGFNPGAVDGYFGPTTRSATTRLQLHYWPKASTAKGGSADGYPGSSSLAKLAGLVKNKKSAFKPIA